MYSMQFHLVHGALIKFPVVAHPYIVGFILIMWSYYPKAPFQAITFIIWTLPKKMFVGLLRCVGFGEEGVQPGNTLSQSPCSSTRLTTFITKIQRVMHRGTKPDTTKVIFLKTASSLDISPTVRWAISRRMPRGMTKHRTQALGGHFLDGCCILPASVLCYFTAPSKASDQSQDTESYLNVYHLHVLAPSSKLPPETRIMTGVSVYIDAIIICRSICMLL